MEKTQGEGGAHRGHAMAAMKMQPIPVSFEEIVSSAPWEAMEKYSPDLVVGIARGGVILAAAAAFRMGSPLETINASLYNDEKPAKEKTGELQLGKAPDVRGKKILLVDDVSNTGRTLEAVKAALLSAGAREIRTFVYAGKADFSCRAFEKCLRFPWEKQ
ncbi:Orotate phosphoribosyltransferase [uncultured archaeon]|nr:Orotate phosphoribosyltransferase [uncultured archaeon]